MLRAAQEQPTRLLGSDSDGLMPGAAKQQARSAGGRQEGRHKGGGLCPLAARELETENMLYFSCTSYQHCNKLCMSTWNIHCTTASVLYMNMKCN